MRFQVLLVTVLALLTSRVFSGTTEIGKSLGLPEKQRRLLRTVSSTTAVDESTEEKSLWTRIKVRWWLETGQTDEYVSKALKLDDVDDATLKTKKNYKHYKYFTKKSLDYRINKWLRKDTTTFTVWKELGFSHITTVNQLDDIMDIPNFHIYTRYVNDFDTNVERTLVAGYNPPAVMIDPWVSEAEMVMRTTIMAQAGRDDNVAKVLLGMTVPGKPREVLQGDALKEHGAIPYFQMFQKLKKELSVPTTTT
ncbi:Secreted RxLR effector peptide protein [Phytophthora palmivora]|uniref:Secreted RxLR effector peptide protein n=1 Tax=Phytophthora palmivora TaxID=4796 RepID=A0A2P4XDS4_9STRA|nr:Secreted RxLR effector peptide protein [Phytophthora palmivora]